MPMLTNKRHETYAQGLFVGKTQRDAFLDAWPSYRKNKDETIDSRASRVRSENPEIDDRLDELREEAFSESVMDVRERMLTLSDMARDDEASYKTRILAIDTLNKMDGTYAKTQMTAAVQGVTIINDTIGQQAPE